MSSIQLGDVCTKESSNIKQSDLDNHDGNYPIYGASGFIRNVDFYTKDKPYIGIVKDGAGVGRVMKLPAYSSVIGTMQYIIPNDGIDVSYLAYAMEHMNLSKYYMGAAIPHIYFKDYKKEKLPLHNANEQAQIVRIIDCICELVKNRNNQLSKLDELVKSRFAEMFGDPVSNTKKWETVLLINLTTKIGSGATPKGGRESYITEGISLIRSMNVYNRYFEYNSLAHITDEQAKKLDNVTIQNNDVLLNITGASVARCCVVPRDVLPARVNQHVCILRCKTEINPFFLCNILTEDNFQVHLLELAGSGATREAITKQQIESLSIIVPPLDLQYQFADFVARVNKTKSSVKQSIKKLETLKKSLMQDYFG